MQVQSQAHQRRIQHSTARESGYWMMVASKNSQCPRQEDSLLSRCVGIQVTSHVLNLLAKRRRSVRLVAAAGQNSQSCSNWILLRLLVPLKAICSRKCAVPLFSFAITYKAHLHAAQHSVYTANQDKFQAFARKSDEISLQLSCPLFPKRLPASIQTPTVTVSCHHFLLNGMAHWPQAEHQKHAGSTSGVYCEATRIPLGSLGDLDFQPQSQS